MFRRTFLVAVAGVTSISMGVDNPRWHSQAQTAKETNTQENEVDTFVNTDTVLAGDTETAIIRTNNTGRQRAVEGAYLSIDDDFTDQLEVRYRIRDGSNNIVVDLPANPSMFPLNFDPGIPLPDGFDTVMFLDNNGPDPLTVSAGVLIRG